VPRPPTPVPDSPEKARQAAHAAALRMLAGREMSQARVGERLRARGFPDEIVEETLARLGRAGVLDDRRAARAAARTLLAVRLRGRHRVGRELERLGFRPDEARDAMQAALAEVGETEVLARVVASRMRGGRTIPDAASYRRVFAALLRRGFPADLIRAALKPYWGHRGEPEEQ